MSELKILQITLLTVILLGCRGLRHERGRQEKARNLSPDMAEPSVHDHDNVLAGEPQPERGTKSAQRPTGSPRLGELPDVPEILPALAPSKLPRASKRPKFTFSHVRFVRLRHPGEDWDLNFEDADTRMLAEIRTRTKLPTSKRIEFITIEQLSKLLETSTLPFLYLTGRKGFSFRQQDLTVLRKYLLERGGCLFADCGGRDFSESLKTLVRCVLGESVKMVDVPDDDGLFSCYYVLRQGAPPLWHHDGTRMWGVTTGRRWIVLCHPGHLSDAWRKGHSGAPEVEVEKAYQIGINLVHYTYWGCLKRPH